MSERAGTAEIIPVREVCRVIGKSCEWFYAHRSELEKEGFPKRDNLLDGWPRRAVEAWLADHPTIAERLAPALKLAKPVRPSPSYVYFVREGTDGPIKIGLARDVSNRVASLQTAHHRVLYVLGSILGDFQTEHEWHERFADYRLMGEWFEPAPDLIAAITQAVSP